MQVFSTDELGCKHGGVEKNFIEIALSDALFARMVKLVARLFKAPMAAISVIDSRSERVRAAYGLDLLEIPAKDSFCAYTVVASDAVVVVDTRKDSRFTNNPLVAGKPKVRFYAGVPLRNRSIAIAGALSIMDTIPRRFRAEQIAALGDLAAMVVAELNRRAITDEGVGISAKEAGEHYRELFENANDIVYTHDLQGNLIAINNAAPRITGYAREEILRLNMFQLLDPVSREKTREIIQQQLGGSTPSPYEVSIETKDGHRVTLELNTRLLFRGGIPIGVQGIGRDITERKRAEAQLRLLKSIVVHSNDGFMVAEANPSDPLGSKIAYVNDAFTQMTGYVDTEAVGKSFRILCGPTTDTRSLEHVRKAVEEWQRTSVELMLHRKDGSIFWADVSVVPIVDEGNARTYWVASFRETTDRKLQEILEKDRNTVLEMVACNEPLEKVLTGLVRLLERQLPDTACSILLFQDGRLRCGAAPSLPAQYAETVEALPGWDETSAVTDVATDPALRGQAGILLKLGLRACWRAPIMSNLEKLLGLFSIFLRTHTKPAEKDLELVQMAGRMAAVAIEQKQLHDRLAYQARHDPLTGLPNRLMLEESLKQAIPEAQRNRSMLAVLYIDLDRFKQINDTLGHTVGDLLLRLVSRRFEACLRKSDLLARMGGDEFTVVLSDVKDPNDAILVAQKLLHALESPFEVETGELYVTASIGISLYPRDGLDEVTLQSNADRAMYRAKAHGKNSFQLCTEQLRASAFERLELENALRHALENGQLQPHYQPQVEMDGRLVGFETLLMWNHPKLGLITPSRFIPIAEESGMIVPIGAWVLHEASRQNARWAAMGYQPVKVAVNVSSMQFAMADFVEIVAEALHKSSLDPSLLELELTESVVMRDVEESARQMERLRALGVSISIDDFGTGYSSLSYLRQLPIDTLKIDQSFLSELEEDSNTIPVVQAIVGLAHSLGLSVIAEGIENEKQLETLRAIGCDKAQGYLLGGPLPPEKAEALLRLGVVTFRRSPQG